MGKELLCKAKYCSMERTFDERGVFLDERMKYQNKLNFYFRVSDQGNNRI